MIFYHMSSSCIFSVQWWVLLLTTLVPYIFTVPEIYLQRKRRQGWLLVWRATEYNFWFWWIITGAAVPAIGDVKVECIIAFDILLNTFGKSSCHCRFNWNWLDCIVELLSEVVLALQKDRNLEHRRKRCVLWTLCRFWVQWVFEVVLHMWRSVEERYGFCKQNFLTNVQNKRSLVWNSLFCDMC